MSLSVIKDLMALQLAQAEGRLTSGAYRHEYELPASLQQHGEQHTLESVRAYAARLTEEPASGSSAPEPSSTIPAGYTYFGQFVTHDLSLFAKPRTLHLPPDGRLGNHRSTRLDLDSVYGRGPVGSPQLYSLPLQASRACERGSFLLSKNREGEDDLLRTEHGFAVLPDHRNDENVMVSQIHLAIQKAHNRLLQARLRAGGDGSLEEAFLHTRQRTLWHYQWLILHDYLPRILDAHVARKLRKALERIADGAPPPVCKPGSALARAVLDPGPWLPLEFVLAGMRCGHAMVRSTYALNCGTHQIRTLSGPGQPVHGHHLQGGRPLIPNWTIDWDFFFPARGAPGDPQTNLQFARPIRPQLSPIFTTLPPDPFQSEAGRPNLAALTLTAGMRMGLTSGQDIARQMQQRGLRVKPLAPSTDSPIADFLWPYVLREAEHKNSGNRLGRLGSWLVLQTIWSRLIHDRSSFLHAPQPYAPPAGAQTVGEFLKALAG